MKKMIILAVAIIISAAANSKNIETKAFNGIRVNLPAEVKVVRGNTYGVHVSASNSSLESAVRTEVVDGVLHLYTRDLEALPEDETIRIVVMVPNDCNVTAGKDVVINSVKSYDENGDDIAMK